MNNNKDLKIRHLELNDIQSLEAFYSEHHSFRTRLLDIDLWQWEFRDNPAAQNNPIPFFVIEDKGQVQGTIGTIPFEISIDGKKYNACHPVNYFVAPEYKGLPALRLLKAVLSEYEIILSSYISDDASKLFKAARFTNLGEYLFDFFFKLDNPENAKSRLIQSLRKVWIAACNFYLRKTLKQTSVYISTTLDARCMPAGDICSSMNGIVKDLAYVTWRYDKSPVLNCTYYYVKSDNTVSNLAVVHTDRDSNRAILLDILGQIENVKIVGLLLTEIIKDCRQKNNKMLLTVTLNIRLKKVLKILGFSKKLSQHGFMLYSKNKDIKPALSEHKDWHFIIGDTDLY